MTLIHKYRKAFSSSNQRFAHLDALRAVAVLLVVVAHAGIGDIVPGGSGVTIFFCISGFVITYLVLKERAETNSFKVTRFYLRRSLKILPPLFFIVLLPTVLFSRFYSLSISDLMGELFFYFNWVYMTGDSQVLPGSGVVWSLSIEEQFYIAFSLLWLMFIRLKNSEAFLAVAAIAVVLYSNITRVILASAPHAHNRIYYGSDTRIDAIALGVLGAIWFFNNRNKAIYSDSKHIRTWNMLLVASALFFIFSLCYRDEWFRNTFRFSFQSISTVVLILFGFRKKSDRLLQAINKFVQSRFVLAIGLSSYSIYLSHLILMDAIDPLFSGTPFSIAVTLKVTLSLTLGILLYLLIEVPALNFKNRLNSTNNKRL